MYDVLYPDYLLLSEKPLATVADCLECIKEFIDSLDESDPWHFQGAPTIVENSVFYGGKFGFVIVRTKP